MKPWVISQLSGRLIVAGLLLAALAVASVPLRYDHANSGRYLLQVIRTADPELFPGDPVIAALGRFRSLFYDLLAVAFNASGAPLEDLEKTLSVLYIVCRVATLLLAMALARTLGGSGAALLLGVWCCFKKSPPVGGDSLFVNVMHHGSVAFLIGVGALLAICNGRRLLAWGLLALTILVHPLMGLHLAFCLILACLLVDRHWHPEDWIGASLFAISIAFYAMTMAPPAMSAEEAAIFIAAKKSISHVSLTAQSPLAWLSEGLVLALAVLLSAGRDRPRGERIAAGALLSGTIGAIGLSAVCELLPYARLVQFQPLRIFAWLHFLAYLLLALATARELPRHTWRGILLLAVFLFSMVPTLWQLPLLVLAVTYFAAEKSGWLRMDLVDRASMLAMAAMVGAMGCGWLLRDKVLSLETLRNPWPPLVGLFLLLWAAAHLRKHRWSTGLVLCLVGFALAGSAIYWHRFYNQLSYPEWGSIFKDRVQPDWRHVRQWIATQTPKTARFLVAGGQGNFRTRALRPARGEPMSALAWVDPRAHLRNEDDAWQVARARSPEGRWELAELTGLARTWNMSFLLVEGAVSPTTATPEVHIGDYRVFATDALVRASASSVP